MLIVLITAGSSALEEPVVLPALEPPTVEDLQAVIIQQNEVINQANQEMAKEKENRETSEGASAALQDIQDGLVTTMPPVSFSLPVRISTRQSQALDIRDKIRVSQ